MYALRVIFLMTFVATCGLSAAVSPAAAQPIELVGARALGMGGTFVAVADDATATYWNPAGLAAGGLFSSVVDRAMFESGAREDAETPRVRASSTFVALGSLPLGLSYYRLSQASAAPAMDGEDPGAVELASLTTHHVGMTLVQSILPDIAVGTTLKVVRGRAAHAVTTDVGPDPIDAAEDLSTRGNTAFDLDLGVMAAAGALRLGLVVRNLREPVFEAPDGSGLSLQRHARAGAALVVHRAWAVAVDADLTRLETPLGDRRDITAGVERWLLDRRLGLRGGLRVNTALDERTPVGSLGASIHVTTTFVIDGHWSGSDEPADRGWGIAGRVAF